MIDEPALQPCGADDLRLQLACALYARGKISAAGGARLAETDLVSFQGALMQRDFRQNYSVNELHEDMAVLRELFALREWT